MNVLVTGGTGSLGREVVKHLRAAGHRAVVLSRRPATGPDRRQGDLATGSGIAEAVAGMDAVVHAGSATVQPWKYEATDVAGTRRLLEAARMAGVSHALYVSIVGMEGVAYPYYKAKLAAEEIVKGGLVPWSILRATQFHTLMELFLNGMAKIPGLLTLPVGWQFQPVDTGDVAARLVEVVAGEPSGLLPDFGGPEVRRFADLAAAWLRAIASSRRVVQVPLPLKFSRSFAEGRLLCPEHRDGKVTFEEYLDRKYGAGAAGGRAL